MFLPQNNSGHGSEMVSPFVEITNTFETAPGRKSEAEAEAVQAVLGLFFALWSMAREGKVEELGLPKNDY